MPESVTALFADPERAEQAIRDLHAIGIEGVRLASPAPYPAVHRAHRPGTERYLGWLVLAGAGAGLALAIALQVHASLVHPFIVGGKPVLAWQAFAIVGFELTMFGAGLTNFVALAVLGALARRRVPHRAREAVASDRLVLVVPLDGRAPEAEDAIRRALAGAEEQLP
jgi:hypothetical protein